MTDQHLITPPPELVQQWAKGARLPDRLATEAQWQQRFALQAAQWGADQELQHCAGWVDQFTHSSSTDLIDARRPKPPSLKEQALQILKKHVDRGCMTDEAIADADILRRALDALPDG